MQTQSDQQAELVRKLRAELAAANERLALQGAHFMEQMRKLGAGTLPASSPARRGEDAPRISLAERVANSRGPQAVPAAADRDAGAAANANGATGASAPSVEPSAAVSGTPRLIDRISSLSKA